MKNVPSRVDYLEVLTSLWGKVSDRMKSVLLVSIDIDTCEMSLGDFASMVRAMLDEHERKKIESGTMIGIHAAQSLGESLTQMTLNSFHHTGTRRGLMSGLNRVKELLDASESVATPFYGPIITTKPQNNPDKLVSRTLAQLSSEYGIRKISTKKTNAYEIFFKLLEDVSYSTVSESRFLSNIVKKSMYHVSKSNEVCFNFGTKKNLDYVKQRTREIAGQHICGVAEAIEFDEESKMLFLNKSKRESRVQWSDFTGACPHIDLTKLRSNDIAFIQSHLGIEAARRFLVEEIVSVLGAEGITLNIRHIMLIADNMTIDGRVAANRYGSISIKDSVIAKATMQQATDTFAAAASKGLTDNLAGVSAQIMLGKLATLGTATVGITYDDVGPVLEKEWGVSRRVRRDEDAYVPSSPGAYVACSPDAYVTGSPEYCPDSPEFLPISPGQSYLEMDI